MPAANEMVIDLGLLAPEVNKIHISADYEPIDDEPVEEGASRSQRDRYGREVPDGTSGLSGRTIPNDQMDAHIPPNSISMVASEKVQTLPLRLCRCGSLSEEWFLRRQTSTGVLKGIDYINDECCTKCHSPEKGYL